MPDPHKSNEDIYNVGWDAPPKPYVAPEVPDEPETTEAPEGTEGTEGVEGEGEGAGEGEGEGEKEEEPPVIEPYMTKEYYAPGYVDPTPPREYPPHIAGFKNYLSNIGNFKKHGYEQ